jgi:hypothetical protein
MLQHLREQAERSSLEVRAAALLRIARVEAASDRPGALRTFDSAVDLIRQFRTSRREWFAGPARTIAAAIAPDRLDTVPASGRVEFGFDPDDLIDVMLDHGHHDAAFSYILHRDHGPDFPMRTVSKVMYGASDQETKAALLRRAIDAWRKGGGRRLHARDDFIHVFQWHWILLPRAEALAVLHDIVDKARRQPSEGTVSALYDSKANVEITSACEVTLFELLHVMRALDPELAESLITQYEQLSTAAKRFPNGRQTMMEEANARRRNMEKPAGGGYCFTGSPEDLPYVHSLIDAERDGNFAPAFEFALEKHRGERRPNFAPKELWASTHAFRDVLYRAAKRLGPAASAFLDQIPDADMRLFAAIEMEAALAGLPALSSVTIHQPRPEIDEETTGAPGGPHIRCPKCGWRPGPHDRWACKCGHIWNTFDTGGVCPACMYQWTETACLRCGEWSPHSDWYAQE